MIDIPKLLSKVDLGELAEKAGTRLRRSGRELRGACPLHDNANNPTSFRVYEAENGDRQHWQCFTGCQGDGGDAIYFMEKWKGLDFIEAIKWLADYAKLSLDEIGFTPEAVEAATERRRQAAVLDEAASYFLHRLYSDEGKAAWEYLTHRRGLTETEINMRSIGFTRSDTGLYQYLKGQGADLALARELGVVRADGLDFTADANGKAASPTGYIVFPHRSPDDHHTTYFSSRGLNPVDPKEKSRNLPGPRQVYWAIRPGDPDLVVVEGQADLCSFDMAKRSTLALCGVGSIPEADLERARRRRTKYLVLDNDDHIPDQTIEEIEEHRQNKAKATQRICTALGPLTRVVDPLPQKDFNDMAQAVMLAPAQPDEDEHKAEKRKLKALAQLAEQVLTASHPWIDDVLAQATAWQPQDIDNQVDQTLKLIGELPALLQKRYRLALAQALGVAGEDIEECQRAIDAAEAAKPNPDEKRMCLARIVRGCLGFGEEPLINCAPKIVAERACDNGIDTPVVFYGIEGALPTGERLEDLEVSAEEFESMRWLSAWGARVWPYVSPGKTWLIARAMKELAANNGLKRVRVYAYSGWTFKDGKPIFLTTSGAITADGLDPDVRVDLGDNNLRFYNLPAPLEDPREAIQASLSFLDLAPLTVTAPLWAALYTAPLGEFFRLNAVLWVYGDSQSLKSTLSMCALTHFGPGFIRANNHEYHAPAEWISTDTNLEGQLFTCKDLPFVVDDYAPQHGTAMQARKIAATANRVIRTVGNRSARGRSKADLTERQSRPPRGLVISTAELPMVGQSIEGRMIYVTVRKGDVPVSDNRCGPLDKAQQFGESGAYAGAMASYIRYIAKNWAAVRETANQDYATADLYARGKFSGNQARLIDYYATLATGIDTALRYALSIHAISQAQYDERRPALKAAIESLLENQSERIAKQSPTLRFFEALTDLQTQGQVYIAPRKAAEPAPEKGFDKPPENTPPMGAKLVGWYGMDQQGERRLYLLTTLCLQLVKEYWERSGESFDMLPDALRRQMAQAGLLVQKDARQFEPSVWIPSFGQTLRVIVVKVDKVGELLNGISPWPEKIITNDVDDGY